MSGIGIMGAVSVFAKMGHLRDGITESGRWQELVPTGIVVQKMAFGIGEHRFRVALRNLTAEQGHDHDAPGDDRIDGYGPL